MIVRFLWMESSFANDGRSDVALQRSNRENVAWLGTTCAGRSHVTNFTRAMNAHTDLVKLPNNSSFTLEANNVRNLLRLSRIVRRIKASGTSMFTRWTIQQIGISLKTKSLYWMCRIQTNWCCLKQCYITASRVTSTWAFLCGTCSRAKEKPMPSKLGGHMGPQPLAQR